MIPMIVAHRGDSYLHPENTHAAFEAACRLEANGIELDLQLSRDEQLMVYHDNYLEKVGYPTRRVCDFTAQQLSRMNVGRWKDRRFQNELMPTLNETLEAYAWQTTLFLEIKAHWNVGCDPRHDLMADVLVNTLRRHDLIDHVFVLCFNRPVLQRIFVREPRIKTAWNLDRLLLNHDGTVNHTSTMSSLSVKIDSLDDITLEYFNRTQTPLMTWTCNSEDQVNRAINANAFAILSDKVEWLQSLLY